MTTGYRLSIRAKELSSGRNELLEGSFISEDVFCKCCRKTHFQEISGLSGNQIKSLSRELLHVIEEFKKGE